MGSLAKGFLRKVCENSAENSWNLQIRKGCGKSAENSRKFAEIILQ